MTEDELINKIIDAITEYLKSHSISVSKTKNASTYEAKYLTNVLEILVLIGKGLIKNSKATVAKPKEDN